MRLLLLCFGLYGCTNPTFRNCDVVEYNRQGMKVEIYATCYVPITVNPVGP